ncbi:MAG: TolC family protein [Magnetococcales bacterium]|nr:TolC family protein [Magnetococcales bacterium]
MPPFILHPGLRRPGLFGTITLLVLSGLCQAEPGQTPELSEQTRSIEPLDLNGISAQPPRALDPEAPFALRDPAKAMETVKLSLEEVRQAVLENQLEVRVERLPPAMAREALKEEEARFDLVFSGSLSQSKTESIYNEKSKYKTVTLGTTIPLRSGGSITVSVPSVRYDGTPDFHTSQVTTTFSKPLLRDGGLLVNTAGIRSAELSAQKADAQAKLMLTNYLANADRAYWRHWAATREIDVRHEQYQLAVKQKQDAEEMLKAGLVARVEIVRSDSGIARRVEDIIVAETNRRLLERELKRIMNSAELAMNGNKALLPSVEPELTQLFVDPEKVLSHAIQNRMELLEAQLQVAIDSLSNEVARHQLLPLFSFEFSHSNKSWSNASLGSSLDHLSNNRYPDWSGGFSLEWPLGNHAAEARLRRSALQRAGSMESLDLRRRLIEKEVRDTVDQLEQNWLRILAARNETRMAEAIYQAELEQFKRNQNTSTQVLDAAQFLGNAKLREISASADYQISKVELAFATGSILGLTRVAIQPVFHHAPP